MESKALCTFKYENDPTILSVSRLILETGCMPRRVVLRELEGKVYVTHFENMMLEGDTWKHRDFYQGHYFHCGNLKGAQEDFQERCNKL